MNENEKKIPETENNTATEQATQSTEPKKPEEPPKSTFTVEPIEFPTATSSVFMNTAQIRARIDDMLRAVLADYAGCEIKINDGVDPTINKFVVPGSAYVNLFFRMNEAPGYHVLKRRGSSKEDNLLTRLTNVCGPMSNRAFDADKDALEAFEEFLPVDPKSRKNAGIIDWQKRVQEYARSMPMGIYPSGFNGGTMIEVRIVGFPLELVLKKIYGGNGNAEKGIVDSTAYFAHPMRCTADGQELMFNITKMNADGVDNLAQALGFGNFNVMAQQSGAFMYSGMPAMTGYNGQSYVTNNIQPGAPQAMYNPTVPTQQG